MEKKTAAAPRQTTKKNPASQDLIFLGKSMDGGFAFSRRGKLDCGKPSAHRCQSQDNSRPKEKYCMANESGAHMARAEDFVFDEYVTRDKMWPQTPQGGGFVRQIGGSCVTCGLAIDTSASRPPLARPHPKTLSEEKNNNNTSNKRDQPISFCWAP